MRTPYDYETVSATARNSQDLVRSLNRQIVDVQHAIRLSRTSIDESRDALSRPFLTLPSSADDPPTGASATAGSARKQAVRSVSAI